MSEITKVTVWTQPGSNLCRRIVELLKEQEVDHEQRMVDGANWTWTQFKAANPDWSNLPLIQMPDGRKIKNIKEFEAEFGKADSIHKPEVKPWAPR